MAAKYCVLRFWLAMAIGGGCAAMHPTTPAVANNGKGKNVKLGNFSVSLTVKNLQASREFYEKLGFHVIGGKEAEHWLILQNDSATIGLFQGMFDKNILTFNPGWDRNSATLPEFEDVRELQKLFLSRGLALTYKADDSMTGPASFMLVDPDGNPILIDQHVPAPKK